MSRKRPGVEIAVTVGLLAAAGGPAWAQVDLVPPGLTYGEAVNCSGLYRALDSGETEPGWQASTFRMLAIEIDEWTNVTADISMARDTLVREAGGEGSQELPLKARLMMVHAELLEQCGGYMSKMHIGLIDRSYRQ